VARPADPGRRWRARVGVAGAVTYLGLVTVVELARDAGGGPDPRDLASSPAGVSSGHLWRLLTSGFVVAGDPVVQLAGTSIAVVAALVLLGPGLFWRAAFAGHVLATVIAYAGVGLLWLVARGDVDAVIDAPDYGISCVWAGTLGVLAAAGMRCPSRPVVLGAAVGTVAVFAAVIPPSHDLAGVEHALAFGLGSVLGARQAPTSSADASASASASASRA
jgi:hypothetical protein